VLMAVRVAARPAGRHRPDGRARRWPRPPTSGPWE